MAIATVADTGRGIPADQLECIFAPFTQVMHDDDNGGLGLGLALVKGIVKAHGGQAFAESDGEGRGARFTIALPLGEE